MSVSLSAERDRIQRQVEELERSLSATHTELEQLSSETDDDSDGEDTEEEAGQCAAGLLAQREKIQQEIQNLENILGPHSPICVSDDNSSSSDESELGLSLSVDSCLQMNLVYQQVIQETLDQLETLLTHNHRQQKEVMSQLSGPIKESSRDQGPPSSCQQSINMFLGRFLKPYFKDKLTGLGPPANQETKEKASRMTGCLNNKKLKLKRWESWQKTLLIHSVARDGLRRLIQPKLSKVDYLSRQLSSAEETDRQQLRQQIDSLEREIDLLREKKEEELIGDQYDDHDWQKISNIDFEGTREAEEICSFWQNFLHPSVNKSRWSQEEVQQLKEVSRRHGERDWESIATELGTGRTAFLCLQTFQRFVSDSLRRGSWTTAEDALLRELVDKMRIGNFIPYTQMSYFMEGRDPAQLIYRWNQVLDPSLKKGLWTKQEDQLLLQAVSRHGEKDWWKIRLEVPGRTDSSCRDRYHDCLKADTKKGGFDKQEQELLQQLVEKHGVGRWARIAAEIPHRNDGQCLREWRKMSKPAPPPAQKKSNAEKPPRSCRRAETKKISPAKKRIRRRLKKLKEEEVEEEKEETSEEEEEMVVKYMDSDEEKKKENRNGGRRKGDKGDKKTKQVVEVSSIEEVEKEEEEEEVYTFPSMKEWTPTEKTQCFTFLNFRPVELPSSGDAHAGKRVRSTILGEFGRSVIIGPQPREVQWEKRHSSNTMMMVSSDQLRAHLQREANKLNLGSRVAGKQKHLSQGSGRGLEFELQAAVMPWIGNVLIPAKSRLMAADVLREQGEKKPLPSTSIFLLFLQTMYMDSVGCKEMIERRNKVVLWTPPPDPSSVQMKDSKTVAGILQQRNIKEELQGFELQHSLILNQLQALQQQKQQRPQQLMMLQHPPLPLPLLMPPQNHPGILLQMPPNVHPQMSPMLFPPAVFISHTPHAASIELRPSTTLTSPPPTPAAPHRLNAPPVSVVPLPLKTTSTCSVSFQQAGLHNLKVALPPLPKKRVGSTGSKKTRQRAGPSNSSRHVAGPSQPCPASSPPSSVPKPHKGRRKKVAEDQQAVGSSQNGVDLGGAVNGVGEGCSGWDGTGDGVIEDGRRTRKLSLKAKALQEAKAEAKKKAASSPRKKARIRNTISPPQTIVSDPPQQVCTAPVQQTPQRPEPAGDALSPLTRTEAPSAREPAPPPLRLDVRPVSVNSTPLPQKAKPASDRTVSSTQNISSTPPPSIPTNQYTASSTSSLPVPLQNDHDYTFFHLGSTPSQHASDSIQPSPAPKKPNSRHRKSEPAPREPPKAPPRGRKRVRGEEPNVTSSQDEQCVGGTGEAVGGAFTGVTLEGKRVRKPSQRARALQEAAQAKAEAKKKRTSSSPRKKCSRTSRSKQGVVEQNQPVSQLSGFSLGPRQSMWVMTRGGVDQLAEALPQRVQLALVPNPMVPAPPGNVLNRPPPTSPRRLTGSPTSVAPKPPPVTISVNLPRRSQPRPLPDPPTCPSKSLPPAIILPPVPHLSPPKPPPKIILPYNGAVRVDPAAPPPLRWKALQFDPSLMFLEPRADVCDWLSGRGGVVVPGAGVALPYLPPFVSSLRTLSELLRTQKSLTKSSVQLLSRGSEPRNPQPKPDSSPKTTSSQEPDLPDSTSDLRAAEDEPAPSVSSDLRQEEAELVAAVRQLVAERFSGNPAYQLLKARFLSCFTVPALLATVQPIKEKPQPRPTNEEEEEKEEEEEVVELKKIRERGKQRRAQRSSLLRAGSGAPANHFAGIITNTPTADQTDPVGPSQIRPG